MLEAMCSYLRSSNKFLYLSAIYCLEPQNWTGFSRGGRVVVSESLTTYLNDDMTPSHQHFLALKRILTL